MFSKTSLLILIAPLLVILTHAQDESCSTADRAKITTLKQQQFGNGTSSGSACACQLLTSFFGSQILSPNGSAYETQATHYYDLRADLAPGCIFVPATAKDVAVGVVILDTCQSQFAVRGAGHMPVVGAANTDGGVLVALSAFINTTLHENTIEAGPGLSWYDMNVALEPQGRMVVGGRMKTIGIAGLTLGGGMSYFNAQYGFTMDNVVAYDIVLGNGSALTASATNNTGLFWALKGGGNNYGIVTKFTYATYPAPSVSTTIQLFAQDQLPAFIEAIADLALYQDQVDTGAGGIFIISWAPSTNSYTGTFFGVQIGDVEKPAVFSNFTAITSEYAAYNVTTLAAWSSALDTPYQRNRTMFGMHVAVATNETMQAMYNYWTAATSQMADIEGFGTTLVFQPLPPSAIAVAQNNGIGNTWGLPVNSYIFWEIETMWINESDDATVEAWAQSTIEAMHAANVEAGVGESLIYYNDAADYQDAFAGFPADNLAKMKEIRDKYDPSLVFTNLCTGGYKLDHAPNA